jgi:hypothetical protein
MCDWLSTRKIQVYSGRHLNWSLCMFDDAFRTVIFKGVFYEYSSLQGSNAV